MKKSIIALAVAGALTAPMVAQADATLFGQIRYDITKEDATDVVSDITRIRFGFKGEETMDSGLTAGYFIRTNATATDGSVNIHKSTVYVSGDFGKIVMGDGGNPNEGVEDRTEFGLYSGTFVHMDSGFSAGGISFESANYNGLKFAVGMGNVDTSDGQAGNAFGASVSYDADNWGVTVGAGQSADTVAVAETFTPDSTTTNASTAAVPASEGDSNYGVSVSGKVAGFNLGARYSTQKAKTGDDAKGYAIGGSYALNDKVTLKLQHESTETGSVEQKMVAFDATYALGGNASVTFAAISYNVDAEAAGKKDAVKLRYNINF
ncbi:MAG: porin [Pseudomonadales bacterium]|nr:porin [Pseudomonadales bacterium]NRA14416.1 porin [Oceanospirillaceae bacterium]